MADLVDSFDDSHAITLANSAPGGAGRVLRPGDIIGGSYQLKSLLGRGGMGYVFCAEHISLHLDYALKMLAPEQLNDVSRRRFEAEGRAIANLDHPNIVKVHNMGLDTADCPFYVMDLLEGKSLAECIAEGEKFALLDLIGIFTQIASGLAYAHSKGIVHRDIKPSNIILLDEKHGRKVKIVDFGIAKLLPSADLHTQSQTATGEVFGSPYYMSPEQTMGLRVEGTSDMYSLGCTLFESLTSYPPFRGENPMQTIMKHQQEAVPSVVEALPAKKIPASVDVLLQKMMAKRPTERYQTMEQLIHDLERLAAGKAVGGSQSPAFSNALTNGATLSEEVEDRSPLSGGAGRKVFIGVSLVSLTLAVLAAVLFLRVPQSPIEAGHENTKTAESIGIINRDIGTLSSGSEDDLTTPKNKIENSPEALAIMDTVSYTKSLNDVQQEKKDLPVVQAIFDRSGPIVSRRIALPDGTRVRRFNFPKHTIGTIVPGLGPEPNRCEAVGQKDLPDRELVLAIGGKSNHILLWTPSIYEKVGPGEFASVFLLGRQENMEAIKKLNVPSEGEGVEKILKTMTHWTKLKQVFFRKLYLTPKMLQTLNDCRNLEVLEINDCREGTAELLKQPILFQIKALFLEDFPDFRQVLTKLKDSPNLVVVRLFKCGVKPEDLQLLAPVRHCNGLHIEEEDLTPLIPAIVALPKIQEVAVGGPKLDAEQIHQLTRCPHILHVTMRIELYEPAEQAELKKYEPKLVFASL